MQNSFITNKDKLLSDIINGILPKSQQEYSQVVLYQRLVR